MEMKELGGTILVGEDEAEVREYLELALKCLGYSVEFAQDGDEVLDCLTSMQSRISAVLLDIVMPQRDGMETLKEIRRIDRNLPVIIVSGASSTLNIVTAMKSGATDFLSKPVDHEDLKKALDKALELRPGDESIRVPRAAPARIAAYPGNSRAMREIQSLLPQIGWSDAPVLIQGETGSGKEVLARELHASSPRSGKVFLKLNCAALPSELVESELFGYERGAFTGAFQKKLGMFELANGGTLLLDEIGDMDVRLQAKLLQVLQEQEFQRIGGKETVRVNVRIIAATHRDLENAIVDRTFREDLYYRLNVVNLYLPPLRERREDIPGLADYLLKKHAIPGRPAPGITTDLREAMLAYDWPGNVREMENAMRKLVVLRDPGLLARELFEKASRRSRPPAPEPVPIREARQAGHSPQHAPPVEAPVLEQVTKNKQRAEAQAILTALDTTRWNRKQAAVMLQIDYKALLYKMKKLGLDGRPAAVGSRYDAPQAVAGNGEF
jgi:two-component system, NtrC family, response regulator AtoC